MANDSASRKRLVTLQEASDRFQSRLVRIGAVGLGLICVVVVIVSLVLKTYSGAVTCGVGLVTYAIAYALTLRGNGLLGRRFFLYGLLLNVIGGALPAPPTDTAIGIHAIIGLFVVMLAGFLAERIDQILATAGALALFALLASKAASVEGYTPALVVNYGIIAALLLLGSAFVTLFVAHFRRNQLELRTYVVEVDRVMTHAEQISKGDLTAQVEGTSDVSETIRAMLEGLRGMVAQSRDAASALSSSATEIAAMARQQEQGALEQASAVSQIQTTLARVLDGSTRATHSTEDVFRNVELTQRTTEVVAQRASALSAHTRRISALLEIIKGIANKSEILALNAALEGARAGEAGRGFSLVASQMQRLAESVMGSVADVRALIEDVDAASAATLASTEESTRLSARATGAAREITGTLDQQRSSTEQVTVAVRDIQQVTAQLSAGSTQALAATRDLARLAAELKQAIEKFQLD